MSALFNPPLEGDALDYERYQVESRFEIVALLRAVAESRGAVTLYFNQGSDFIVSGILGVNPEFEELILDLGADAAANRRLLKAERVTVISFLDNIRLQFHVQRVEETVHEQLPALRIRLPDALLRLQRRNSYRVRAPVAKPIAATFPHPLQRDKHLAMRIADLSCGGVALVSAETDPALLPGMLLRNCRIDLPEVGVIDSVLEVRSVANHAEGARSRQLRYGCQFVSLPPALASAVQRYITRIERTRAQRR